MNKYLSLSIAGSIALLISLAGCSQAELEPAHIVIPGDIRLETESSHAEGQSHDMARVIIAGHTVSVPRSFQGEVYEGTVEVQAGVSFDVTVHTFASLCHQVEESSVEVGASRAVISVFDSIPPDVEACALALILLPRTDTIAFSEPGEAEVVIRGNTRGDDLHPFELRFPVIVKE